MNGNPVVVVHNHLYLFWPGFNKHGTQETSSFWEALEFFLMVTEYHKFLWQVKNAESILEYERMAEIGFEKRDFRMVSYSLDTVLVGFLFCVCVCFICEVFYLWGVLCHKYLPSQASRTAGICLCLGCLLHGPCLGFCLRLSQVQDTKSRVFSPAGAIPRGSVCSQVRMHTWKDLFIFWHYCQRDMMGEKSLRCVVALTWSTTKQYTFLRQGHWNVQAVISMQVEELSGWKITAGQGTDP